MRAALGTMALLLFGQAFGDDQKPYKITLTDLDQPTSASEHRRWTKALTEKLNGKQVEVTGMLRASSERPRDGQVWLSGAAVTNSGQTDSRVYLKVDRPVDQYGEAVRVTGTARIENGPVQVWIDKPKIERIKKGAKPPGD